MYKTFLASALALTATLLFLVPAFSQMDIEQLDDPAFANGQRPPAVFVHDEHNEIAELYDCVVCHHMDGSDPDPMEDSIGIPCSDCHPVDAGDETTPLMQAYHKQCKGCHQDQKAGPVACGECHVRQ